MFPKGNENYVCRIHSTLAHVDSQFERNRLSTEASTFPSDSFKAGLALKFISRTVFEVKLML